jgi:endonuclease YncB( thermonuclease family)
MTRISRICVRVIDGDTFVTNRGVRIGLARVKPPSVNTPEGRIAKGLLESLILGQFVVYDTVAMGTRRGAVEALAEVYVDNNNVNDAMRAAGYAEPSGEMVTSSCGTKTEE